MEEKLGATGKFPEGKLNEDDEGELAFGVARDGRNIILKFGKPVAWMAMPAPLARQLAMLLISHANAIDADKPA